MRVSSEGGFEGRVVAVGISEPVVELEGKAVCSCEATDPRLPRIRVAFELRVEVGRSEEREGDPEFRETREEVGVAERVCWA